MALKVGELFAELKIDRAAFDAGLQSAQRALKGTEGAAKTTEGILGRLNNTFKQVAITAAGFAVAQVGMKAVGSALGFVKDSAIGLNNMLQQAKIGFTTMLGSAQQADAFLRQLADFAKKTPFEFPELVTAAQRMKAYGFAAEEVIPLLTDVGNVSAGLGAGTEGINRMTTALGQMAAKGKVQTQELLQLTELGIPAFEILAQGIGKTVAETQDLVSKGQITSDTFLRLFHEWSQANFGGMMEQQARTFSGAMSNITDSLRMASANAFRPFFDLLTEGAIKLTDFLDSDRFARWLSVVEDVSQRAAESLRNIGAALGGFIGAGVQQELKRRGIDLSDLRRALDRELETRIRPAFRQVQGWAQDIARKFRQAGFGDALREMGEHLRRLFTGERREQVQKIADAVAEIVRHAASENAQRAFELFAWFFTEVLPPAVGVISDVLGKIIDLGAELAENEGVVNGAAEAAEWLLGAWLAWKTVNTVFGTVQDITGRIKDVAGAAADAYQKSRRLVRYLLNIPGQTVDKVGQIADTLGRIGSKTVQLLVDIPTWVELYIEHFKTKLDNLKDKTVTITQNIVRRGEELLTDLVDRTVTITQNVVRSGAELITDLANKTQTITQEVKRKGDQWISDFSDRVQRVTQIVTVQKIETPESVVEGAGKSIARGLASAIGAAIGGAIVGSGLASAIGGALAAVVATVGWAVIAAVAIALLVGALIVAFWDEIPGLWDEIKRFFTETLPDKFREIDWGKLASDALYGLGFALGAALAGIFLVLGGLVLVNAAGLVRSAGEGLSGLADTVSDKFEEAKRAITERLGEAWEWISREVPTWPGRIEGFIRDLPERTWNVFTSAKDRIVEAVTGAWNWLQAEVPTWPGRIEGFIQDLPDRARAIFTSAKDRMVEALSAAWQWISTEVPTWPGRIEDWIRDLPRKIGDIASAAADAFLRPFEGLLSRLAGPLNAILRGIGSFVNGVIDGINWVGEKLGLGKLIPSHWSPPQVDTGGGGGGWVNARRHGGTVRPGELTLVGEAGPELVKLPAGATVIPHDETQRIMRGVDSGPLGPVPRGIGGPADVAKDILSRVGSLASSAWNTLTDWVKRGAGWVVDQAFRAAGVSLSIPGALGQIVPTVLGRVRDAAVDLVKGLLDGLLAVDGLSAAGAWMKPLASYVITQEFGRTPFAESGAYAGAPHTGIDLAAPLGTPVRAARSGSVRTAGWLGGYGNAIILRHLDNLETLYGHLSRILVKVGQTVQAGGTIGAVGNTGYSTGPHLHFEVRRNGVPINPRSVMALANGGVITSPTIALLGETAAARPEIVAPEAAIARVVDEALDRRFPADGAGMGPVTDITNVFQIDSREIARAAMRGLSGQVRLGWRGNIG